MPIARQSCRVAGSREILVEGKVYADDHPLVLARPELFEDADDHLKRTARPTSTAELPWRNAPVERATAAPGEKRTTKRKSSKAKVDESDDDES